MRSLLFRLARLAPGNLGPVFLLCAAVLPSAGHSADRLPSPAPFVSQGSAFDEKGGAALFANICAACHRPDGRGAVGAVSYPSLVGNPSLASAEYLENLLFNGLRAMPPVGRMMSDEQAADVVNYARSHFGGISDAAVSPADIKRIRPETGSSR
jgi:mono/diheme cytochrome c family protein